MIPFLLLAALGGWQPGLIETHHYKLGESVIPGTSTYTLRGILREGRKVLVVEVETHRTLTLGGQQGKLESHGESFLDPETFDLLESRLITTLNKVEASYLHALRKGKTIEVHQQLRGSPLDTRTVEAPGVAIDESAINFYLERVTWAAGKKVEWLRYSAAQSRVLPNSATLDKTEKDNLRIKVETDIGPNLYDIRPGKSPVVVRMEAAGSEQFHLADAK